MQSKRPELHVTGSEQQHYIEALSKVWMNCFLAAKGDRSLLGSGVFLGTELAGKGRSHRSEAADGSWACPVTITERKCDGLSGFCHS